MKWTLRRKPSATPDILIPPAYPLTGCQLFQDLRRRLAKEYQEPMYFKRLARMMGRSESTTYTWFEFYRHPHVLGFMCLLERLSPGQRRAFVDAHCRVTPSLQHSCFARNPSQITKLRELLNQRTGLTVITGGTDVARTFLLTALGHACGRLPVPAGLDQHRPINFVPVESLLYIDSSLGLKRVRRLTLEVWPKLLTSRSSILFFNGIWSAVSEVQGDLIQCSQRKHIVLAESNLPDLTGLKKQLAPPIHVITVLTSRGIGGAMTFRFRIANLLKPQKK
jgi:hypothetical protein